MTLEELKDALQAFYDTYDEISISVYALLKDEGNTAPKKVDIEASAQTDLKELFINYLKEHINQKDDLSLLNFSTADERVDAIYLYDLDVPDDLSVMSEVTDSDSLPLLDLSTHDLNSIRALIIEIGNNDHQIVLYKTVAAVNVYGRNGFFLKKHQTRMEKIDNEFLRISPNFQLLRVNEKIVVLDLEAIERSFGFVDIIKREGAQGIMSITEMGLIENPEVLNELLEELRYAKRFARVAKSSPVRDAGIPNDKIIEFCQRFPKLRGKIRFNSSGNKILLDTKVSKDLFIKLLMDDFLKSELTSYYYESVAKDRADAGGS